MTPSTLQSFFEIIQIFTDEITKYVCDNKTLPKDFAKKDNVSLSGLLSCVIINETFLFNW
jgi:hypothetical protein